MYYDRGAVEVREDLKILPFEMHASKSGLEDPQLSDFQEFGWEERKSHPPEDHILHLTEIREESGSSSLISRLDLERAN